jgi:hypothetical protein
VTASSGLIAFLSKRIHWTQLSGWTLLLALQFLRMRYTRLKHLASFIAQSIVRVCENAAYRSMVFRYREQLETIRYILWCERARTHRCVLEPMSNREQHSLADAENSLRPYCMSCNTTKQADNGANALCKLCKNHVSGYTLALLATSQTLANSESRPKALYCVT